MIQLKALHKYFNRRKRNEIHVLNDITLDLPEKGLVVLLGPSGSGKTTLLNVLGGLDSVQEGTIIFGDKTLKGYHAQAWDKIRNEHVGYIFQNYNLLPDMSVFENIAFVLKMMGINDQEIIKERVEYILKAVNMFPFRKKKATQLSGGQQQRVAIARAIVKNPNVVIADEPTGNLDSKNTLDIMNIIKQISEQTLVVLVTHEKNIAELYADRIIEIKDGEIISDVENSSDGHHDFGPDETIYLKDLNKVDGQIDDYLNVNYYSDQKQSTPIEVRLIVKNKTLYLDVDSKFNKVKLVDKGSGIKIEDAHYVKKTRAELMETTFNRDEIDNTNVPRQRHSIVSIKQSLWLAVKKILQATRRGKLMLFAFAVAGMVIALSISMFATAVIIDPEPSMVLDRGYVRVNSSVYFDTADINYLEGLTDTDDSYFINPYGSISAYFLTPQGTNGSLTISGNINLFKVLNDRQLDKGSIPEEGSLGIVVTRALADNLIASYQGQDFGIWNDDALLNESVNIAGLTVPITGIAKSGIEMIYMSDELAATYLLSLSNQYAVITNEFLDEYSSADLAYGDLPTSSVGQVISTTLFTSLLPLTNPATASFPITTDGYVITGLIESDDMIIYMYKDAFIRSYLESSRTLFIHSNDAPELIEKLKSDGELTGTFTDIYQTAFDSLRQQQQLILASSITTFAILIGASLIGFYFVIRSSLISRIYEVSVYRALGVHKRDIFSSFLVEISILTTVSTLLGYLLATMLLSRLTQGLLGDLNFILVTPLTIGAGLILVYGLNILAGIAPVYFLLRKTPAQILSQYDI